MLPDSSEQNDKSPLWPIDVVSRHAFVDGSTVAGKHTTLLRSVLNLLQARDVSVLFIDRKEESYEIWRELEAHRNRRRFNFDVDDGNSSTPDD